MYPARREFLAGLGLLGFAGAARASSTVDDEVAIPMRAALGRRWTPGVVDDARDLRCVFSTRAQLFQIDDRSLKAANLQALPLQTGDRRLYRAGLIGLGGAYGFRQVEVIGLAPDRQEPLFHLQVPVLQDAPSLYDFAGSRFVVNWNAAGATDFGSIVMPSVGRGREPWMRIPAVNVQLDGMPLRLQIDTTSPYGVSLYADAVERLGLWDRWTGGYDRVADSESGADRGDAVRVRRAGKLDILDWSLDGPVVGLRRSANARPRIAGIDGMVGMDVLGRFAVGIEPDGWRLRLRRNSGVDTPFRHDRSGVQLAWRDGRQTVVAVDPGSPAEAAGLRAGDVTDLPDTVTAETFEWVASDPAASSATLTIIRRGVATQTQIALADRL